MNRFIHLNVKSEYSLLMSAARIEDLVKQASHLGMTALALTDHGVMYGAIPFYEACQKYGIKPIIGCDMAIRSTAAVAAAYEGRGHVKVPDTQETIVHTERRNLPQEAPPYFRLTLLAKNMTGYRNLMALSSIAQQQEQHEPHIDYGDLSNHAAGIICLSSGLRGEIAHYILRDQFDEAVASAQRLQHIFGADFYLEVQDHGIYEQKIVIQQLRRLQKLTDIPLVATNDVHYVREEDHIVQDVVQCIRTGHTLTDDDRSKLPTQQFYLKSGAQMNELFNDLPEAIQNTVHIAAQCDLQLPFGQTLLPQFEPLPAGVDAAAYLAALCRQGLLERYGQTAQWNDPSFRDRAEERLNYELNVIESMGFSDYFLIVWDFIRFAHEKKIRVGAGRGSSAGSLVAYVLKITDVDPLRYRLLFERFLNPERISMPDIDIDFDDERRDEVIQYVVQKYGADRVAQIITFGTMAARAAIRDVGRVLDLPLGDVDRAAKMVPNQVGMTIKRALQLNEDLRQFAAENEQHAHFIQLALKVEGLPRHASTHAAGVVISHEPLTHHVPLQAGADGVALTQYAMDHLQAIGLLKMDFLGLRTLSIIERTLSWIREHEQIELDFQHVSDRDEKTYALLSRGDTDGVFQLESAGVRRVLKELKPTEFEDIISVLALYRPGPMDFIPQFIASKHGKRAITYPHPSLKPILADTYGIIVYQEQIMQIASSMAGFSLGEADLLRRAVSKKERDVLDEERAHFVSGSVKQGYTEEVANNVYDMIVRFANYGFPRAHAAAYGVLAYQTAYLKANYPVYFIASMLTAVSGNQQKVAQYIDECRKLGIEVLPPDVNESGILFEPISPKQHGNALGAIRFGMSGIKNVGTLAMHSLIEQRQESPFTSLLDLCRRVDLKVCNKRVLESLIQSGAMDRLPGHRAQLLAMLDETIEAALKWKKEREDLQISLFGLSERINWTIAYPDVHPPTTLEQLQWERELLGCYISGHPLDSYEAQLAHLRSDALHELGEVPEGRTATVACMVLAVRTILTKKGQRMAFAEIEDRVAKVDVVLFPRVWEQCHSWLEPGRLIYLQGTVQKEEDGVKLLARSVRQLDEVLQQVIARRQASSTRSGRAGVKYAAWSAQLNHQTSRPAPPSVYIKIAAEHEQEKVLNALKHELLSHRGTHRVILYYERQKRQLALSSKYNVDPNERFIQSVHVLLGNDAIKVT